MPRTPTTAFVFLYTVYASNNILFPSFHNFIFNPSPGNTCPVNLNSTDSTLDASFFNSFCTILLTTVPYVARPLLDMKYHE